MTQVFISYSRKDFDFVEQLASDLKEAGLDVWYDLSDLHGGSRWSKEIESAIRASKNVLIVLSPESVSSKWVEEEFLFASKLNKKIIPLLFKKCELPFGFHALQSIDIQGINYKRNFGEILHSLGVNSGKDPIPPKQLIPWKTWSFAGAVLLIALIIGWFLGGGPGQSPPTHTPTSVMTTSTFTLEPTKTPSPTLTVTASPTSTQIPSETPVPILAPIAGTWIGVDKGTVGGNPVADREVEITIKADCNIGDDCGTRVVKVNDSQCGGSLILVDVQDNEFTFDAVPSKESASFCGDGGEIMIRSMPDGTLTSESDGYNSTGARVIKTGTFTHP